MVVRDYLENNSFDALIDLGDVIGYGANPNECYEWVLQNASIRLMGNHEQGLFDHELRASFSQNALTAIEWTENILSQNYIENAKQLTYAAKKDSLEFVHSSLESPQLFSYLKTFDDARPCFEKMSERICFIGHTHFPGYFSEKTESVEYLKEGVVALNANERYILNPGSVGQPRDGDKRASFACFDSEKMTFEIIRLAYDKELAANKIRQAELPSFLADRLL